MSKPLTFIGIDNGLTGAIAWLDAEGSFMGVWDTPTRSYGTRNEVDELTLYSILSQWDAETTVVVQEAGQIQPKWGPKKNWINGENHGVVRAAVSLWSSNRARHHQIDPVLWQRPLLREIRSSGQDTKGASIELCRRLWPQAGITKDGHADALCLAEWGRRKTLFGKAGGL